MTREDVHVHLEEDLLTEIDQRRYEYQAEAGTELSRSEVANVLFAALIGYEPDDADKREWEEILEWYVDDPLAIVEMLDPAAVLRALGTVDVDAVGAALDANAVGTRKADSKGRFNLGASDFGNREQLIIAADPE